MIPELAIAMLACARIGAVHSIVFGGFSAEALADRIVDSACQIVLTTDGMFRGDRPMERKQPADEAIALANSRMGNTSVHTCIVVQRVGEDSGIACPMREGRDLWWHEAMSEADADCPCEEMDAEDPLFILYTSGSTGKPKGVQHTVGGYMVYTGYTHKNVFDYQDGDIYFCAADIGWITGHSYIIYGPLSNAATTIMFESTPVYPDPGRYWQVIDKYKVNQFYTAPTAIRAPHPRRRRMARQIRPVIPQNTRHSGGTHQSRSLAMVSSQCRARAVSHRRYLVANRTGGILISPCPAQPPPNPGSATFPSTASNPSSSNPNRAKSSKAMASMAYSPSQNPGRDKCVPSMAITNALKKPTFSNTKASTSRVTAAAETKMATTGLPAA